MPDYTRSTGSAGTMMIRDNTTNIELWLKCDDLQTWVGDGTLQYRTTTSLNPDVWAGWTGNIAWTYSNAQGWKKVHTLSGNPTTNIKIEFRINATGTMGFGGPTVLQASITRQSTPTVRFRIAKDPANPAYWPKCHIQPWYWDLRPESLFLLYEPVSTGGSSILEFETTVNGFSPQSSGITWGMTRSGLNPGLNYTFGVRARNSLGWGNWATPVSTVMPGYLRIKDDGGVWRKSVPLIRHTDGQYYLSRPYLKNNDLWEVPF